MAVQRLMEEHGYSHERAVATVLAQLTAQQQQHPTDKEVSLFGLLAITEYYFITSLLVRTFLVVFFTHIDFTFITLLLSSLTLNKDL